MPRNTKRGRHTSLNRDIKKSVETLEAEKIIKKIIIGTSRSVLHGRKAGTLRIQRVEDGKPIIHLAAYGDRGITDVLVICHKLADVAAVTQRIAQLSP